MSQCASQHKQRCNKAELFDEALFKRPPPREKCPICFHTLQLNDSDSHYQSCCGKIICFACLSGVIIHDDRDLCPFCRAPETTSDGERIERLNKRVEANDANGTFVLAFYYSTGESGLTQDYEKAIELYLKAGKLGSARAYRNMARCHALGEGVDGDMRKSKHFAELAAMGGDVVSRHNLGAIEEQSGNTERAKKHLMIAAGAGWDDSLRAIRQGYLSGHATKYDFEKALRGHQKAQDEMKSDQREAFAAFRDSQVGIEDLVDTF